MIARFGCPSTYISERSWWCSSVAHIVLFRVILSIVLLAYGEKEICLHLLNFFGSGIEITSTVPHAEGVLVIFWTG